MQHGVHMCVSHFRFCFSFTYHTNRENFISIFIQNVVGLNAYIQPTNIGFYEHFFRISWHFNDIARNNVDAHTYTNDLECEYFSFYIEILCILIVSFDMILILVYDLHFWYKKCILLNLKRKYYGGVGKINQTETKRQYLTVFLAEKKPFSR